MLHLRNIGDKFFFFVLPVQSHKQRILNFFGGKIKKSFFLIAIIPLFTIFSDHYIRSIESLVVSLISAYISHIIFIAMLVDSLDQQVFQFIHHHHTNQPTYLPTRNSIREPSDRKTDYRQQQRVTTQVREKSQGRALPPVTLLLNQTTSCPPATATPAIAMVVSWAPPQHIDLQTRQNFCWPASPVLVLADGPRRR